MGRYSKRNIIEWVASASARDHLTLCWIDLKLHEGHVDVDYTRLVGNSCH